ncbi:MAG: alpha/beta hydrolase [Saprospiraceae bacterium]
MQSQFIKANGIKIHYLEYKGKEPTVILLHGLTANAWSFAGIFNTGFKHRVLAIDLRGRGESEKPDTGYTMKDHANDIIGLMDALNIKKAILGGHSYGALLSIYIAYHFPNRVDKIILIDAAARMHPDTREMIGPSVARLSLTWPDFETYLNSIRSAEYIGDQWHSDMELYYKADVTLAENGTLVTKSNSDHIQAAVQDIYEIGAKWLDYISGLEHESILLNGTGIYALGAPILPQELAMETVNLMKNCVYENIPGNHLTMLYGDGAFKIAKSIERLLDDDKN